MTIHPHWRPEQLPAKPAADDWQAASEQWWDDEEDFSRPPPAWLGIAVLAIFVGLMALAIWGLWR